MGNTAIADQKECLLRERERERERESRPEGGLAARPARLTQQEDDELDSIVYLSPQVPMLAGDVVQKLLFAVYACWCACVLVRVQVCR